VARYKLKLKQLDFVSLVDDPAQPNAKCLLIKRAGKPDEVTATARLVKTNDELGLAFFWAFTTTNPDGSEHYDLHGDQVMSGDEMIKAAAAFMESGGAVDEMHDSEATGRVVFAMPMTPEIAKAYGVESKTSGLMVAIRPSADAMAKLKDGTYTAVSIAGIGERVQARKARVLKTALYTDEVDGHQHKICFFDDGSLYVEHATMAGAEYSHSHGIIRGENSTLEILADSGHKHTLAEGQASLVVVAPDAVVVVQANAPGMKSTRPIEPSKPVLTMKEPTMANDAEKTIAELTKQLEHVSKLATLTDAQRMHYKSKSGADADGFLAKSHDERQVVLDAVEKANPIVYTAKSSGRVFRESDRSSGIVDMAEMLDKQAESLAKRDEAIEKAEIARVAKEALEGVAGDDETHAYIVKSIRKGGGDAAMIEKAMTTLRSSKEFTRAGRVAKGINPGTDPQPESLESQVEVLAQKIATEQKIDIVKARGLVFDTTEGAALYAQIEKRKQNRNGAPA